MAENVRVLNEENWANEVIEAPGPVLVDFWAPWCAPCRLVAPEVEALAGRMAERVAVGKLNVDASPSVALRYGVRSIPTLVLFEGGREADRRIGFADREELASWVERRHTEAPVGTR